MKTLLLITVFFASSFVAKSQQFSFANGDFEQWDPPAGAPPFNWQEPTGWKSTNAQTEFIQAGIYISSTNPSSGQYSAGIQTTNLTNASGEHQPSVLCNGNPIAFMDWTSSEFGIDIMTGGEPISTVPYLVNGSYNFSSPSNGDSAYVEILVTKYDVANNQTVVIAEGNQLLSTNTNWEAFNIYTNTILSGETPDTIVVAFYSTKPLTKFPGQSMQGGSLRIDDLTYTAGNTSINEVKDESDIKLFPNPAATHFNIDWKYFDELTKWALYDIRGKLVLSGNTQRVESSSLKSGIYALQLTSDKKMRTKKVIIK